MFCSQLELFEMLSNAISIIELWSNAIIPIWHIYSALSFPFCILAGSFFFGILSDRFGRKPALMLAMAVVCVAGTISAFVPIPPVFGVLRFLTGMGGMACYIVVSLYIFYKC
jgi:MFS family permease